MSGVPCRSDLPDAIHSVGAVPIGAATLTIGRSLMTKERTVYRTSLHLEKVIVHVRINIQGEEDETPITPRSAPGGAVVYVSQTGVHAQFGVSV